MNLITKAIARAAEDIDAFARHILRRPLRPYQVPFARAVVRSIIARDGEQFIYRISRQAGKNETIAIVQAYTLWLYQRAGGTMVHTAPTFKPQARNAQDRLISITAGNPLFAELRVTGDTVTFGRAVVHFVSGAIRREPLVGLTASLCLFKDEAQDLDEAYMQKAFDPMTLSTNATHVHTGTARNTGTYLARKRLALERQEARDGLPRVFVHNWRDVAAVVPAYGRAAQATIDMLGPNHPSVQTELENIETDATGRLFDQRRIALIFAGRQARITQPDSDTRYAITVDVGGSSIDGQTREHDATVIAAHCVTRDASGQQAYTTVDYLTFQGADVISDTAPARAQIFAYIARWRPYSIVIDATGLGVGFASAAIARFGSDGFVGPNRVSPVTLSESKKTQLLNNFLALVETGRYTHYTAPADGTVDADAARYRTQLEQCDHQQHGNQTRYSVPSDATWTNPTTAQRQPLHDDLLMANILLGELFGDTPAADFFAPFVIEPTTTSRRTGKF